MPAPTLDVATLPLVLVGPILRRVTSTSVSVFVVLKAAATVSMEVGLYDSAAPAQSFGSAAVLVGTEHTVALGAHVHVAVVTCSIGSASLAHGSIYAYRLQFTKDLNPTTVDLFAPGVLHHFGTVEDREALVCYGNFHYPTFMLPALDLNDVRLLHGSCRKPHGGKRDALSIVDQILEATAGNPSARPQQLWMTGDQIYADDVHEEVLGLITEVRSLLFSWTDQLTDPAAVPDLSRGRAAYAIALGFSWVKRDRLNHSYVSEDARTYHNNRLLFFQEYCAMYMLVWSPVLWQWMDPVLSDVEVASFRGELSKVRRALANIPTYMMFDDHEITDDLLLNLAWVIKMAEATNDNARAVLGNGFTAYAIFQHWGNVPERFQPGSGNSEALLLTALRRPNVVSSGPTAQDWVEIRTLVLPALSQSSSPGGEYTHELVHAGICMPWHYSYQDTSLPFEVLVLDTRTRRSYPNASVSRPAGYPGLISASGIQDMVPSFVPSGVRISIIVSPAPFSGVRFVETKQREYARINQAQDQREYEAEAWSLDLIAQQRLMHQLATRTPMMAGGHKIVFLSGDVHYGFSQRFQYWYHPAAAPGQTPQAEALFIAAQLTSSALKNFNAEYWLGLVLKGGSKALHEYGFAPLGGLPAIVKVVGWENDPNWADESSSGNSNHASTPVLRHGIFSSSWHPKPFWATRPSTAPDSYNGLWRIQLDECLRLGDSGTSRFAQFPDWEFRIDHFEMFPPAGAPPPNPVPARHLHAWQEEAGTQCIGVPNIGSVRFAWQEDEYLDDHRFVWHDLWWRKSDLDDAEPHSQFGIPLGATYVNPAMGVEFARPSVSTPLVFRLTPSLGR
jgi:hypothetical protein